MTQLSIQTPEQQAAWDRGINSAHNSLSKSERPLAIMINNPPMANINDKQSCFEFVEDFEAMGWNSVRRCSENIVRWELFKNQLKNGDISIKNASSVFHAAISK